MSGLNKDAELQAISEGWISPEDLPELCARQRDLGISWAIQYVRKSGLPYSHTISERLEFLRESVR